MQPVPLLAGSRLIVVSAGDDDVVLAPPPPPERQILDVAAAVRDALRFPLAGEPLEVRLGPGARVTVLADLPALPLPSAGDDPRREAVAAVVDELRAAGVPDERITLLFAGGLWRRPGRGEIDLLVSPPFARAFHGEVVVHDAEDERLVAVGEWDGVPLRLSPALVQADLVIVVSAAETVLHGGPAALLAAGGREALRAAGAESLVQTAGSRGWQLAVAAERALGARAEVLGVSLALGHPRLSDTIYGYPYERDARERIARSPFARLFRFLPTPARVQVLRSLAPSVGATIVLAGPPSVAHAEALLRAIEIRSASLDRPLDAICMGIPRTTPHLPRERPNPLLALYLGLGLALRLWRDAPPVVENGTAILAHRLHRHFAHPTQQPYRAFFQATRSGPDPEAVAAAERAAAVDRRALDAYRAGRACHPLLPFADWAACGPARRRLGAVLVAGCRDATSTRHLGAIPAHGVTAALDMAIGRAGGTPRIGFLLGPPYFPIRVGGV